jgi:predicted AAA+ superfamily ATPase
MVEYNIIYDKRFGPPRKTFLGNAVAKIMDFLITTKDWDYSQSDIAKNAGVSVRTVQREMSKLLDSKLVKQVRTVGNAKMYRLNKPDKIALSAEDFVFALAQEQMRIAAAIIPPKVKLFKFSNNGRY